MAVNSLRVKKTVEGNVVCAKAMLLLKPAPPRGLNCMGSASLKGASLAGATLMIVASPANFKRPCIPPEARPLRLCADGEPRPRAPAGRQQDGEPAGSAGATGKF